MHYCDGFNTRYLVIPLIPQLSSIQVDVMLAEQLNVIPLQARVWPVPIPPYLALAATPHNFHDNPQQLGDQK